MLFAVNTQDGNEDCLDEVWHTPMASVVVYNSRGGKLIEIGSACHKGVPWGAGSSRHDRFESLVGAWDKKRCKWAFQKLRKSWWYHVNNFKSQQRRDCD